jgi:hypothetical protein
LTEQPGQTNTRHLDYPDSATGVAAIIVMTYHYLNWIHENSLTAKAGSIITGAK